MGVRTDYGREYRPVRVVTYSLACDAWGCGAWLRLTVADEPGFGQEPGTILHVEGVPIPWEDDGDGEAISCVDDAIRYATKEQGWQEGEWGVQRGHLYCPKHRREEQ